MKHDSKYTEDEHKILSAILYRIQKYQKLLRANTGLCCKLFKYNYHLAKEQQILYHQFRYNALSILLYVKHISNMWKYPEIIDILGWISFDVSRSRNSRFMLYFMRTKIIEKIQIILHHINSIIFEESMITWRNALLIMNKITHQRYLNESTLDRQLNYRTILINDCVQCTNSSCRKGWLQNKHDFKILPAEIDTMKQQKMAQEETKNEIDMIENMTNRYNTKKKTIQNKWYKCKKCKLFYCSRKCQKYDWKHHNHRETCNKLMCLCRKK